MPVLAFDEIVKPKILSFEEITATPEPNVYDGLNPQETETKAKEVWDAAIDSEITTDEIENYPSIIEDPKEVSAKIEQQKRMSTVAPWLLQVDIPKQFQRPYTTERPQAFKAPPPDGRGFWKWLWQERIVGKAPPLPPDADRIEKVDRAFRTVLGKPLRGFLKFAKGMTLGVADILWAGLKRVVPEEDWADEYENLTLDQAMDRAAGYYPGEFETMMGEIADFAGRLRTIAPVAEQYNAWAAGERSLTVLEQAAETALLFGAAGASEEAVKFASDRIDPTETEYGYIGPRAVLEDMAIGALFSLVHSGVKGAWSKLTPSEEARALKVLGLKKGASQAEITKAANELALKTHPDKVEGLRSEFEKVIQARDTLRAQPKRDIIFRGQKVKFTPKLLPGEKYVDGQIVKPEAKPPPKPTEAKPPISVATKKPQKTPKPPAEKGGAKPAEGKIEYDKMAEDIGGVSHFTRFLPGVIRSYAEQGPNAGAAMLQQAIERVSETDADDTIGKVFQTPDSPAAQKFFKEMDAEIQSRLTQPPTEKGGAKPAGGEVEGKRPKPIRLTDESIIHPSARNKGKIQMTYFTKEGKAMGHEEYNSVQDALEDNFEKINHPVFRRFNRAEDAIKWHGEALSNENIKPLRKGKKYTYISTMRPLAGVGVKGIWADVDNGRKSVLWTDEAIPLDKQEHLSLIPFSTEAINAAVGEYAAEVGPLTQPPTEPAGGEVEGLTIGEIPNTGNPRADNRTYLTEILPEKFTIYREIIVPEGQQANLRQPGESWSETRRGAVRGVTDVSGESVILEADISRSDIDVDASINARMRYGEPEIRLKQKPTNVRIAKSLTHPPTEKGGAKAEGKKGPEFKTNDRSLQMLEKEARQAGVLNEGNEAKYRKLAVAITELEGGGDFVKLEHAAEAIALVRYPETEWTTPKSETMANGTIRAIRGPGSPLYERNAAIYEAAGVPIAKPSEGKKVVEGKEIDRGKHPQQEKLLVRIGGSNRKLDRQLSAFKQAGIELKQSGHTTGHHSNRHALMPNTPEARALLKETGGTIDRKQWDWLSTPTPPKAEGKKVVEGKRRMKPIEWKSFGGDKTYNAKSFVEYKGYQIAKNPEGAYDIIKGGRAVSNYGGLNSAKKRIDTLVKESAPTQPTEKGADQAIAKQPKHGAENTGVTRAEYEKIKAKQKKGKLPGGREAGAINVEPLSKAVDKMLELLEPAKLAQREVGKDVTAQTIKALHRADVARIEFNEQEFDNLEGTLAQFGDKLAEYSDKVLSLLALTRGKPVGNNAKLIQEEALEQLKKEAPELIGTRDMINRVADFNYDFLKDVAGDEVGYVEDYFYGVYKNPAKVTNLLNYWKTTDKFTKEKRWPTFADARAFDPEIELKHPNPIENLKAEYLAIARLSGMTDLRDSLLETGDFLKPTESAPADFAPIMDPVFKGYRASPKLAKLINSLISTNKITRVPLLNALRQANNFLRNVKFFGSLFHLGVILEQSIVDTGIREVINDPMAGLKAFTTLGFKKHDPIFKTPEYKQYIENGGGHRYSIESDAQKSFRNAVNSMNKAGSTAVKVVGLPVTIAERVTEWMFESYIPKIKYMKYLANVRVQEQKLGRSLTDAERQEIIKEGQNFYGEMNERVFGRSGTMTTLLRFKFMAPGWFEGNLRTVLKALTQWGQDGTYDAHRSRRNIVNAVAFGVAVATVGTLIMTGKPPKRPESLEDIPDLFKIDTGQVDAKGDKIMIDTMKTAKDYWLLTGNIVKGPRDYIHDAFKRFGGMTAVSWDVMSDLNQIAQGKAVYDWKGDRVVEITDPFIERTLKLALHELAKAEPIPASVFIQSKRKGLDTMLAAAMSLAGVRLTKTEQAKREQEVLTKIYSLHDQQDRLYYYLGRLDNPRAEIKNYNKTVMRILDNPNTPQEFRDEYEDKLIIDVDRLVSNKVYNLLSEQATLEEKMGDPKASKKEIKEHNESIGKNQAWLDNFKVPPSEYRKQVEMREMRTRKLIKEIRPEDLREDLKKDLAKFYTKKTFLMWSKRRGDAMRVEERELKKLKSLEDSISELAGVIYDSTSATRRRSSFDRIEQILKRSE
jgi:curved DNA-binding protein CbpA